MIKSFDQGKFERMFVQPKVVEPEDKVIYLTFDDGPEKYTLRIL